MPPIASKSPARTSRAASASVVNLPACRRSRRIRFDPQVEILDDARGFRFVGRAGKGDRAVLENIDDVREVQGEARVLFDEQHREAALLDQMAHDAEHLL